MQPQSLSNNYFEEHMAKSLRRAKNTMYETSTV